MLIESVLLAGGAKIIHDLKTSDELNEQARKKNIRALSRVAEAQIEQKNAEATMNQEILRLYNRKKAVLSTSMDSFLHLYEKIIKINFTETEGIIELKSFTPEIRKKIYTNINTARATAPMPVITKNVIVGFLLNGVTGAIISSIVDDSQRNLDEARIRARQAEAVALQAQTISLSYQGITERVKRITDVLTRLNILFVKSIRYSNELIDKNGIQKSSYSFSNRQSLAVCVNLAKAVKDLLDAPIIDQNSEVSQKSLEAVQIGEQCLQAVNNTISNI